MGQLGVSPLVALQGLELMVELHGSQVWDALLALSGPAPHSSLQLCLPTYASSIAHPLDWVFLGGRGGGGGESYSLHL